MRSTRAHTANRRSHFALEGVRLSKCADCGAMHVRHQACPSCGKYRGKVVISFEKKAPAEKAAAKASKGGESKKAKKAKK